MTRQLVFVHGRSQENKDAVTLKQEWIDAFRKGLAKNGKQLPIPEADIRFPYYGQTLYDLISEVPADQVAEVIVKGTRTDTVRRAFVEAVLGEVCAKARINDDKAQAMIGCEVVEHGVQNKKWVLGILRAIDKYVPYASGAAIAVATNDVYQYLRNSGIRDSIDGGVRAALEVPVQKVVVAHSLGTIVSYNLLTREGESNKWDVSLFMTLGSPLGITMIKDNLKPVRSPRCVAKWVNALDPADVVALYPLKKPRFGVQPSIENLTHVHNETENRHGILGYFDDKEVAKRIYDALV